jgi:hypothetical protein
VPNERGVLSCLSATVRRLRRLSFRSSRGFMLLVVFLVVGLRTVVVYCWRGVVLRGEAVLNLYMAVCACGFRLQLRYEIRGAVK